MKLLERLRRRKYIRQSVCLVCGDPSVSPNEYTHNGKPARLCEWHNAMFQMGATR